MAMHARRGEPIAQGRTAEILVWDTGTVLKRYRSGMPSHTAHSEARLTRAARVAGLRVPAVWGVVDYEGRRCLGIERIEGPTLLELLLARPDAVEEHGLILAELLADAHGRTAAELPDHRAELGAKIRGAAQLPARTKKALLAELDRMPRGDSFCHGDLHPGNVVMGAAGPVVLDWSSASRGRGLADLARTLLIAEHASLARCPPPDFEVVRERFLAVVRERYAALRPYDEAELARWKRLMLAAGER